MTNRRLRKWSDSRGISKQKSAENDWKSLVLRLSTLHESMQLSGTSGYVLNKIEELTEYCEAKRTGDENGWIDAIVDSRVFDATELIKEGYCITDCDDEVLKVLESRTGQWDDKLGKFVKCQTKKCKDKWYKENYVKNCKYKCKNVL